MQRRASQATMVIANVQEIGDMINPKVVSVVGGSPAWEGSMADGGVALNDGKAANEAVDDDGDLGRLIRLLTNEDTAELSKRQLAVIWRVCKVRQKGFRYSELALVERLLPLVEARVSSGQGSEFRTPLLKLLDICSFAPVRDRANQEFTEHGLTTSSSLFRVLGRMLWSPDAGIQSATAETLRKIAAGNDPARPNTQDDGETPKFGECQHDLRPKPRDINQALLLGCGVVTSAVACLDMVMSFVLVSLADLDELSLQSSDLDDRDSGEDESGGRFSVECEANQQAPKQNTGLEMVGESSVANNDLETRVEEGDRQVKPVDDGRVAADAALKYAALVSLLQFVRELSTDSASSAAMVEAGLVSLLVRLLRSARGVRDPTLPVTVEVMWNCLEHSQNTMTFDPAAKSRTGLIRKSRKSNATFVLSSWDGVSSLRDAVEALLIAGFREKDKELRNEALIVASLLASNVRSHRLFRTTGMLLLLLRYATAIETGLADGDPYAAEAEARIFALVGEEAINGSDDVEKKEVPELGALADPRNFASTKEVDLELKILVWSLLADLCKRDASNVVVVEASPLIETLLMYMDLVVEEGQSADGPPPGMNRSVSLASMPPLGNGQLNSAGFGANHASSAASKEEGGHDFRGLPEAVQDPCPATPPSGGTPTSSAYPERASNPSRSESRMKEIAPSSPAADMVSNTTPKSGSSVVEGSGANPALGLTQLYVPATIVRLPVTSIQLLQGQAMASLLVLAPKCPAKFQALGGHMVTLRLLDRLGSRPENQRLVKMATKMLAAVVSLPGLKEELGRVDGVRIMLNRFSQEWKHDQHSDGGSSAGGGKDGGSGSGEDAGELRTDTVIILCRLCEECPANQEAFRKADGVPLIMAAVKAYCRARSEAKQQEGSGSSWGGGGGVGGSGGSSLSLKGSTGGAESGGLGSESIDPSLVHIIDCLWCAVVGNRRSEARLLQCEGLDTLLDLLELCPVFMRHQVTGVIADLLSNKRSIPYARAWRSDLNMLSITQLMVRLWVAEEARLGVSRPNGVLQNLWQPLQSHDRGSVRRKEISENYRGAVSGTPTQGNSLGTAITTSGGNTSSDVCPSRTNGSSARTLTADVAESAPITSAEGVFTGLAVEMSEARDTSGTASNPQGTTEAPSAIALALQAGKLAVTVGDRRRGGQGKKTSPVTAEASVAKAMSHLDLRGKIAAVLGMVGFDGSATAGLGPSDLKASYMATSYMDFRSGEAWQEVAAELKAQHINPIAADALVLDTMLERAFDCAQEVKSKQMALTVEQGQRNGEKEEAFFAGILFQRDQEIRQAMIKRNALLPGASKKRLAAKKAKEMMIKRSSDRSLRESGDMGAGSEEGTAEEYLESELNLIAAGNRPGISSAG